MKLRFYHGSDKHGSKCIKSNMIIIKGCLTTSKEYAYRYVKNGGLLFYADLESNFLEIKNLFLSNLLLRWYDFIGKESMIDIVFQKYGNPEQTIIASESHNIAITGWIK